MLTYTPDSVTIGLQSNKLSTRRVLFLAFSGLYVRSMWQIWALNSAVL